MQVNTSISTVSLTSGDTLDVISEFSNCTQNPEIAPVNNCTIDSKFGQALRSADEGKPLTVQAIDKGLIITVGVLKNYVPLVNVRLMLGIYLILKN